jgi:hypothetical protein
MRPITCSAKDYALLDRWFEKLLTQVPHSREFSVWKRRLTTQEIESIRNALDAKIDSDEVHTSSWIPGADWSGTPFEPIYLKACRFDEEASAKCFGLFVWEVFMARDEDWSFGRFEKDGMPIAGLTYFRI